jgi:hypothetical protein
MEAHNHPRFVEGRNRLARVVRLLLAENQLSHSDLETFYRWACPDTPTWLNKSQVSTLRNAKLPKPGPQLFDALSQINLRLAKLAGSNADLVQELDDRGPLPPDLKHLAGTAFFMVNPQTQQPMEVGDLFRLYVGRLEMKDQAWDDLPAVYTDDEAAQISYRLALWFQKTAAAQDRVAMEFRPQFIEAYPYAADDRRRERLWRVLMGTETLNAKELSEEREALRFTVGKLERGTALTVREFDRWCHGALPQP